MTPLARDYVWNSIGTFLQSAISPVLLVVITRLNGIDDSGLFSFAMSISVIFWAMSMWGSRTYQVSDAKKEFSSGGYIAVRFITSALVIIFALLFCILNGYDELKTNLIITLVLFKVVESIADPFYGILQIHGKLYMAGISLTIKAIGGFLVFVAVDMVSKNILFGALALLMVNVIIIVVFDLLWSGRAEKIVISRSQIKLYLTEALTVMRRTSPVFVVVFLTMFSLNIPRYFLDIYHPNEIGYFGIMAMPITLLALFISFIIQPNIVGMSKIYAQKEIAKFDESVSRMITVAGATGVGVLLVTYFFGVWAIDTIFGISLGQYKLELMIMVTGAAISALVSIYVNVLIVMRLFKGQFYTLLLSNVLLVVVSPLMISRYAMLGSVILFSLIGVLQLILLTLIYKRKVKTLTI